MIADGANAPHACVSCKQRKRLCDKRKPSCSECIKKRRDCDYNWAVEISITPKKKKPDSLALSLNQRPETYLNLTNEYFLESSAWLQANAKLPEPSFSIHQSAIDDLGNLHDIYSMLEAFFVISRNWMPFVSRKLIFDYVDEHADLQISNWSPSVLLLLYCMKLSLWEPGDKTTTPSNPIAHEVNPRTTAYTDAKVWLLEVELSGCLSLTVLQAGLLVALYEFCHSIYPSAYLSIGTCARYATALGVDQPQPNFGHTWVQSEERKRVWWAIRILDRALSLGCPERELATPDPEYNASLPVDDATWDLGDFPPAIYTLQTDPEIFSGKFARLAQAAYLLSQVLRHSRELKTATEYDDLRENAVQIDRTLRALIDLADLEAGLRNIPICAQKSLSFAALIVLNRLWAGNCSSGSPPPVFNPTSNPTSFQCSSSSHFRSHSTSSSDASPIAGVFPTSFPLQQIQEQRPGMPRSNSSPSSFNSTPRFSFSPALPGMTAPSHIGSELVFLASQSCNTSQSCDTKNTKLGHLSPMSVFWTYWSCSFFRQQYQEYGSAQSLAAYRVTRGALEGLKQRWCCASTYMRILDDTPTHGAL